MRRRIGRHVGAARVIKLALCTEPAPASFDEVGAVGLTWAQWWHVGFVSTLPRALGGRVSRLLAHRTGRQCSRRASSSDAGPLPIDDAEATTRVFELGRCGVEVGTSVRELGAELPVFLRKIRHGRRIAARVIVGGEQVGSWCGEHGLIGHKFYRLGEAAGVGALRRKVGGLGPYRA